MTSNQGLFGESSNVYPAPASKANPLAWTEVPAGVRGVDDLGGEFDIHADWDYSKSLLLYAAFAYNFSDDVAKEFTVNRKDNAVMYTMGAKLRF